MTHEEVVTTHVAPVVRSYRDLPFSLYHFQVKERDEPRPRAGVLRTREFIMKDAYTFDRDREGLDAHYERYREAYDRICDRVGLEWYRVESDVGMMGGVGAHEYMAPCPAGENDVALAPGYAANVEVASADAQPVELPDGRREPERVHTPGLTTVQEVAQALHAPPGALLKAYPVIIEDRGLMLVVVRGDHRVNDIKLAQRARRHVPARARGGVRRADRAGRLHRPGRHRRPDPARRRRRARRLHHRRQPDNAHLRGVEPGRDFPFKRGDVRSVEPGDTVNGHPIRIEPAIEVGNIFKLGTRYSEPLGATYLDESGKAQPIWMGSYGLGPARIAAAAVEQFADENGISWPRVDRAVRHPPRRPRQATAATSARSPSASTASCRRPACASSTTTATPGRARSSPTPSCSACPMRADRRSAHAGRRRGRGAGAARPRGPHACRWRAPRRRPRTCGGAPRSRGRRARPADVPPPQRPRPLGSAAAARRVKGEPLRPWTIPNAIGYIRLALIPVFLIIAFSIRRRAVPGWRC